MKQLKYYLIGIIAVLCTAMLSSCDDSLPKGIDSPYDVDLLEVVLLEGSKEHVGTIDEDTKRVSFKRLSRKTDFSQLKLKMKASAGASLTNEDYDFSSLETEDGVKLVVRVAHNTRYKEYLVEVLKKVPPKGVNLKEYKEYKYIGDAIYEPLSLDKTRWADMDSEHILFVSRQGGTNPHLLKIEDVKAGKVGPENRIPLSTAGVEGGTFVISSGSLIHGNAYICNLADPSGGGVFKIYHWRTDSPNSAPTVLSITKDDIPGYSKEGAGNARFGDNMSASIDERGNGFLYFGVNAKQTTYNIMRVQVKNFNEWGNISLINTTSEGTNVHGAAWSTFNQVDGSPTEYLYTGHDSPIMLTDNIGKVTYTIPETYIHKYAGSDAHILNFFNARYLIMTAGYRSSFLSVYDITKGETTKEALELIVKEKKDPDCKILTGGDIPGGAAAGLTAWSPSKDGESLYIFSGGPQVGFILVEFSKSTEEPDDEDDEEKPAEPTQPEE